MVHGKSRWRVRWHEFGLVKRRFFSSRDAADAFAASKRGELVGVRQLLAALSQVEQEKLVMVHNEARRRGVDVLDLLAAKSNESSVTLAPAIGAVIKEMLADKLDSPLKREYIKVLGYVCNAFARGREELPINKISFADVKIYLAGKSLNYRPTLRGRLSALFSYAVREGYRPDNPCDRLDSVKLPKLPPQIFSPAQAKICLKHFKAKPKGAAWFILTTFAGLRPDEARKVDREKLIVDLRSKKPFVEVTPDICKTGQWRIVYARPEVVRALKWALKRGAVLPLSVSARRAVLIALKKKLGLARWPKDITRHSASSYWLAMVNDQKHVAEMLGHSERTARTTYKKPVSKAEAKAFFATLALLK